jgi:hypothetical protein
MPLQSDFPIRKAFALCIRIVQRTDVRAGHTQTLVRLIYGHLFNFASIAIADTDFRRASNMWSATLNFDEHLCFVTVDTPGQSRFVRELVAGSLMESKDWGRLGVEVALEQDLDFEY